jgi:hypothetical protein
MPISAANGIPYRTQGKLCWARKNHAATGSQSLFGPGPQLDALAEYSPTGKIRKSCDTLLRIW